MIKFLQKKRNYDQTNYENFQQGMNLDSTLLYDFSFLCVFSSLLCLSIPSGSFFIRSAFFVF